MKTKAYCNDYDAIYALADELGIDTRELTDGANGYPSNLRLCLAGFDSFEQARQIAEEYGGEVTSISRRDGWSLWMHDSYQFDPFDMASILSREYENAESVDILDCKASLDAYIEAMKEQLAEQIMGCSDDSDLGEVAERIERIRKVCDEYCDLEDNELLLVFNERSSATETHDRYALAYYLDSWHYEIAVEFPEGDLDDDDDDEE